MHPTPVLVNAPPKLGVFGIFFWRSNLLVSGKLESLPWLLQREECPRVKQNQMLFHIQFDVLKFESVSNNIIRGLTVLLALKFSHFLGGPTNLKVLFNLQDF